MTSISFSHTWLVLMQASKRNNTVRAMAFHSGSQQELTVDMWLLRPLTVSLRVLVEGMGTWMLTQGK